MNDAAQLLAVDKRIADKKKQLLELWNDPELAPWVAALRNGAQPPKAQSSKPLFTPPAGFKDGHGIREAMRKLFEDDSHPFFHMQTFTRDNVKNFLDELYGKDTYSANAVGDALYHFSKHKELVKRVGGGQGGKPTIYARI